MRTELTDFIAEKTTQVLTCTIKDETDVVIPLDQIVTLTLTLYNQESRSIINLRENQNVLNLNNVTYHVTSGLLTWLLQPADTAIENIAKSIEVRVALFQWTFSGGGAKHGKHEIVFKIRNLEKVS
jgi:hypothetical protein